MKQIDPVHFQGADTATLNFYAVAPEGAKAADAFDARFWSKVASTPATRTRISHDCLLRIRAHDRSWDVAFVCIGLRPDRTPILKPWPNNGSSDVFLDAFADLPRSTADALKELNLGPTASLDSIEAVGRALRAAWHPDRARDEQDRIVRETKLKRLHRALDVLRAAYSAAPARA